jgi:DNA/RNA-binding domain of Phe-tRNA-synthetase-like protein
VGAAFLVTDDCRRLGLRAGALRFRNVAVSETPAELQSAVAGEAEAVRARFASPAAIRAVPEVVAFQQLLRRAGAQPRRDQPSVERLLSFALKRGTLPAINSFVDAYNLVSIRTLCSLGAHDVDRIALPITLRLLNGSESFTPLGADTPVPVTAGEFGYVDAAGRVLCRLDVLQADFSKVTNATRNAVLIIEGTASHPDAALSRAFAEAAEITRWCGGAVETLALPG